LSSSRWLPSELRVAGGLLVLTDGQRDFPRRNQCSGQLQARYSKY
jgi:hypothetical protein